MVSLCLLHDVIDKRARAFVVSCAGRVITKPDVRNRNLGGVERSGNSVDKIAIGPNAYVYWR